MAKGKNSEVARLFLKLGLIAFGGPAAHIALMRQEVVQCRHWHGEQEFLDLLGASNLIPGPTSTELAIYLGYTRAGRMGLLLAGGLFIFPAVVLQAIYGLLRTAVKSWTLGVVVLASIGLYAVGLNPLVPLFGLAILVMLFHNRVRVLGTALIVPPDLLAQVFPPATFIGYLVGSWPGAVLATVAIFLPSFVFVAIVYPLVPRLRASPWTSAFLDGANAAAVGLMAAVTWQLGQASIIDLLTAGLAVLAAVLLIRF